MQAFRIFVENGDTPRVQASFGLQGGTIGRADHNTLVLSDDERSVSRLHARVEWRGGRFLLVNMGINPVLCDGVLLSTADEVELAHGQALRIGRFVLGVQRIDSQDDPALARDDEEELFDDMTGLPLPRRPSPAATLPIDISLFDLRSVTAPAPPDLLLSSGPVPLAPARASAWLPELLRGLGCAPHEVPAAMAPHAVGAALRQAVDEALRAAAAGAGTQTRWAVFEQALLRACRADDEPQT